MNQDHVSEEALQQYALGGAADRDVALHIESCPGCQRQVKAYRALYAHVRDAEAPVMDERTRAFILGRLPQPANAEGAETRLVYILLAGFGLLLIAALIACWSSLEGLFNGVSAAALVPMLVVLLALVSLQLGDQYRLYRKKIRQYNLQ